MADGSVLSETMSRKLASQAGTRAVLIGNFPPRVCGIATFTRDLLGGLRSASSDVGWSVVAMADNNTDMHDLPIGVSRLIKESDPSQYVAAAEAINRSGADFVIVQHEYGIFGGSAGEHLLLLLARLRMPVIVTMHTVLREPDSDQRRVTAAILDLAAAVIVMARKGAAILKQTYPGSESKVHVAPHGAPSRALASTSTFKTRLGLAQRPTLSTFGLLSPNKGIETVVRALPDVVVRIPDVQYLIAGATHPNLLAREGERYRDGLVAMARELGVEANVQFVNRYLDDQEVVDILLASDLYVTPYLTESQITSGTLSYAIALGRAVVSTPYWHAEEALEGGVGVLCPFGDSACFADAISDILADEKRRAAMANRAWRAGLPSRWLNVGKSYLEIAAQVTGMKSGARIEAERKSCGRIAVQPCLPAAPAQLEALEMFDRE